MAQLHEIIEAIDNYVRTYGKQPSLVSSAAPFTVVDGIPHQKMDAALASLYSISVVGKEGGWYVPLKPKFMLSGVPVVVPPHVPGSVYYIESPEVLPSTEPALPKCSCGAAKVGSDKHSSWCK